MTGMDMTDPTLPTAELGPTSPAPDLDRAALTRRGFLRTAALTGGGLMAVTLAACSPASARPSWTYGPGLASGAPASSGSPAPSDGAASPEPSMDHGSPAPSGSAEPAPSATPDANIPPGWSEHDVLAKQQVDRFLAAEWDTLPVPNAILEPRLDGDVKVFDMTIDEIEHRIDAQKDPLKALGYNGVWTGPQLRVIEGDTVRAIFKNNLSETTGVHFHGQRVPNSVDGVPLITQDPIVPGGEWTYEFVARVPGSHMYHSHHNATDQVGRGLLGAFIVEPRDEAQRPANLYGVSQDIVWISNDTLGGFTINGRGFPATYPIVAQLGDKIMVRFMNEGLMMHPWHLHGMPMRVVARDGYDLGSAAFTCDTLGVNPGERFDVVIDCDEPGVWAFHCHILTHAEGMDGMFGMVTALIVQDGAAAIDVLAPMADLAVGRTAKVPFVCPIPGTSA
jgi:FtsP/CotA-like multicopper oxidase with cupredoxin domain